MSWASDGVPVPAVVPDAGASSVWTEPPSENRVQSGGFESASPWVLTAGATLQSGVVYSESLALQLQTNFGFGSPTDQNAVQSGLNLSGSDAFELYLAVNGAVSFDSGVNDHHWLNVDVDRGDGFYSTLATFKRSDSNGWTEKGPIVFAPLGEVGRLRLMTTSRDVNGLFFGPSWWYVDVVVIRAEPPVYVPGPVPSSSWTREGY